MPVEVHGGLHGLLICTWGDSLCFAVFASGHVLMAVSLLIQPLMTTNKKGCNQHVHNRPVPKCTWTLSASCSELHQSNAKWLPHMHTHANGSPLAPGNIPCRPPCDTKQRVYCYNCTLHCCKQKVAAHGTGGASCQGHSTTAAPASPSQHTDHVAPSWRRRHL